MKTPEELGAECAFSGMDETMGPRCGLSKRELFAALALQGRIAAGNYHWETVAEGAVMAADALLAELCRETPKGLTS